MVLSGLGRLEGDWGALLEHMPEMRNELHEKLDGLEQKSGSGARNEAQAILSAQTFVKEVADKLEGRR